MIFQLDRDPYVKGQYLRKRRTFEINPNVTMLVGCNGSGKSTLLNEIKEYCKIQHIPCLYFDNLTEDNRSDRFLLNSIEDMSYVMNLKMFASEGEGIMMRISEFSLKLGRFCKKYENADQIFLLFDSTGSGLSIDNIIHIKSLFNLVLDNKPQHQDIYILVSTNEFEFCKDEQCFDVQQCKYRQFKSYITFRNFILKSRERRDAVDATK